MKKWLLVISLVYPLLSIAQPVVNGDLSDSQYSTVGTFTGTNNGFGSGNNLSVIKTFASTTDLYIGIGGVLESGNRIILIMNFSGYDGKSAGTNIGNFANGAGNLPNSGNTNVRVGLETDYAIEINRFSTDVYVDANRWGTSGGIGGSYQGQANLTGTPTTTGTLASTEPWGTTTPNITFAMNNGGGTNQGFEIRIPFSSIPGVTIAQSVSFFAIIANNDGTIFFSNECIPSAPEGTGNYGTNPEITVAGTTNQPLPVELTSFTATPYGKNVILNWTTATEINNYGFEIERKNSGQNWNKIGFVNGHGNSNSLKEYSFTDKSTTSGKYFYRLKQIDTDGSYEYSPEVEVDVYTPGIFSLEQNYPNPFNPNTVIGWQLAYAGYVSLKVYDILGNEVATLVDDYKPAGRYEVEFNAGNLSSGIYFYKIQSADYVQIRKMTILK